jgi:hypothetical protein
MERDEIILNLAWEVIKTVREREVWLWLADDWDGAYLAEARWHPEGVQLSARRHDDVALAMPGGIVLN